MLSFFVDHFPLHLKLINGTSAPTNVPGLRWPTTATTTGSDHNFYLKFSFIYFYYICASEMRKCETVIENIFSISIFRNATKHLENNLVFEKYFPSNQTLPQYLCSCNVAFISYSDFVSKKDIDGNQIGLHGIQRKC